MEPNLFVARLHAGHSPHLDHACPIVTYGIESDSSSNSRDPLGVVTREGACGTPRQIADLRGYAPALARIQRDRGPRQDRNPFIRLRFHPGRTRGAPVVTREARAYPLRADPSDSSRPARARSITCRQIIVVRTVADTAGNVKGFGPLGASRGTMAYPQLRSVSLVENGTFRYVGTPRLRRALATRSSKGCSDNSAGYADPAP